MDKYLNEINDIKDQLMATYQFTKNMDFETGNFFKSFTLILLDLRIELYQNY